VLFVDKTGTITEGKPTVKQIFSLEGISNDKLLILAASAEIQSEHPLAQAIVKIAKEKNLSLKDTKNFQSIPGGGVIAEIENQKIVIGQFSLLKKHNIIGLEILQAQIAHLQGSTLVFIALNNKVIGFIALADSIKTTAPEAVSTLHKLGIKIVMLTGD